MPKAKRDYALDFITRWRQVASPAVQEALVARGFAVRHQEAPGGEAKFDDTREWRFDWSVPALKVAVEIDGGNWMVRYSKKQHRYVPVGRHTQSDDYEKRNAAVEAGWSVLCYTTDMLKKDPYACVKQVEWVIRRKL